MTSPNADFVLSTELECLSSTPQSPGEVSRAMEALLRNLAELAPTLPGPGGIFNPYGRIYIDCGHVELAMIESHSPYALALIVERQQRLVARAREYVAASGTNLLLANNNHSGLLQPGCPVWGSHENYLVEQHPTQFTDLILPFLVTRIYAGAGGIEHPTGNFLAAVRPLCMEAVSGGGTTGDRAIHSTSRDEHHMGATPNRYRYHGILGDGHRSQFNLALQFGATALALKAIMFDGELRRDLGRLGEFAGGNWVQSLQRLNVLQRPGAELHIDPLVVQVQRVYLVAARRYVDRLEVLPDWIPESLQDWEDTLMAFERLDRPWLAARLDTFAKFEVYSSVLANEGFAWPDLPEHPHLFPELALLDHSYHNFCDPESVFSMLEHDGLVQHRVGPHVLAGEEADPFIPECATRAAARARFIKEHAGEEQYVVDWSRVWDRKESRFATLDDPFATEFDAWTSMMDPTERTEEVRARRSLRQLRELLGSRDEVPF